MPVHNYVYVPMLTVTPMPMPPCPRQHTCVHSHAHVYVPMLTVTPMPSPTSVRPSLTHGLDLLN